MKRIACLFTLVMLFGSFTLADEVKWRKYTNEEGAYSILLPKEPTEKTQEAQTALGVIKVKMQIAELSADAAYLIAVNDYPQAVKNGPADNVLDGVVKGVLGDGKLVSSDKITYKDTKIPGEMVCIKQGAHFRVHIFLSGARLYQVMAIGKEDDIKSKETSKFFESFEIKLAETK